MKIETITWKFPYPEPILICMNCKNQAINTAECGDFTLFLCETCSKLDEAELLKTIGAT